MFDRLKLSCIPLCIVFIPGALGGNRNAERDRKGKACGIARTDPHAPGERQRGEEVADNSHAERCLGIVGLATLSERGRGAQPLAAPSQLSELDKLKKGK